MTALKFFGQHVLLTQLDVALDPLLEHIALSYCQLDSIYKYANLCKICVHGMQFHNISAVLYTFNLHTGLLIDLR